MQRVALCALALLSLLNTSKAQDWGLDPTFADGGVYLDTLGWPIAMCNDVAIQPDGKIVMVGFVGNNALAPWWWDWFAMRLNPDGTLDSSFANAGHLIQPGPNSNAKAMAVHIDGQDRIVIGGFHYDGVEQWPMIVRLTPDGQFDATFGNDGIVLYDHPGSVSTFYDLALQSDDQILITFDTPQGFGVTRVGTDGVQDLSFGNGGWTFISDDDGIASVGQLDVMPDGRIVVCGYTGQFVPDQGNKIVRLMPDGSPDPSFGNGGIAAINLMHAPVQTLLGKMALAPDGSIYMAGLAHRVLPPPDWYQHAMLAHVLSDGSIDTQFGDQAGYTMFQGAFLLELFTDVSYSPQGKIILSGFTQDPLTEEYQGTLWQYTLDGQLDTSFADDGLLIHSLSGSITTQCMALQTDGSILMGGHYQAPAPIFAYLARVAEGVIDQVGDAPGNGQADEWNVWPNPASDHFNLRVPGPAGSTAVVRLLDPLGREVHRWDRIVSTEGTARFQLPGHLTPGCYMLEWSSGNTRRSERIMIE